MIHRVLPFFPALALMTRLLAANPPGDTGKPVSYYRDIRPIFQANCQGCHQPAKAKGGYVMTGVEQLRGNGDSGKPGVVPGKPAESFLLAQVTPQNGEAEMPQGKPPLTEPERLLIQRWISQGATDDTPTNARQAYDAKHPPRYTRPPVIGALEYSPDGRWLAVAGFHEVLLHKADGSGLETRLIGLSERIQSIRFSPDGRRLAVAGGQPGRMGELQIWDVDQRRLTVSVPVGSDTLYGASWSPDGRLVAFGCPDNTVRAVDAATGRQVLQQGSHNDWVLDTLFTRNGDHVVSVGRDMSAKLTELATQRFVDNITSITPGALRGGLQSVARHPERDEILVGGADGTPQIYRVFRTTTRRIGDNAALIRRFPAMEGRLFSVDYSPDGRMIAAGASRDTSGSVVVYRADFDPVLPTNLVRSLEKTVSGQTAEERAAIERWVTSGIELMHTVHLTNTPVYAIAFAPDGRQLAIAGQDGVVRLLEVGSGRIHKTFAAAPLSRASRSRVASSATAPASAPSRSTPSNPPAGPAAAESNEPTAKASTPPRIQRLEIQPATVALRSRNAQVQVIVLGHTSEGETIDLTREARFTVPARVAEVSPSGRVTPRANGRGTLRADHAGVHAEVPIEVAQVRKEYEADFIRDVNPVLSKLGCNAGTCHGAKDGKNGFKLSLRGYDPVYDVRSLADDLASRRVNLASPDDSLMLLKATGAVPHEGGQRTTMDTTHYAILRQWIASGARLRLETPKVTRIEVLPANPVVLATGARQQMRVVATYADGASRDVTAEAFIESGNGDIVSVEPGGLVTTLRRGEAPLLARFEGAYDATTVTVMGDRSGFVWKQPETYNRIDELVVEKWKRMKILPSELCSDTDFLRRVYLDLTGLPPTPEAVRAFMQDPAPSRAKRDAVVDRLIGSSEFVDHWANKWADLLQVNRKFLGEEGALRFRDWIRKEIETNTPYDQFAAKILTASGSNKENPAAAYWKILRGGTETMENTTHLFLATRFNCNKCHDHPFERWTQDQYYQLAAFFAQVDLRKDEASGDKTIGGTAVEGAKPLFEIVSDKADGEMKHDRTGRVTEPAFPFPAGNRADDAAATRRTRLAHWLTAPDNRYFASSYVNRLWGYLLGTGLIEPIDDIRAGNPPTNPDLLKHLTDEFVQSRFNTRHLLALICKSRTYQLSVAAHRWNADDKINYSHALPRRLPAEVLLDAVYQVTGSAPEFPGVKAGIRSAQLPDSGIDLPSGILATLGRPPRESACECERSNDLRLGSIMSLMSGPTVSAAVNNPKNAVASLVASQPDDRKLINELYLRILNRPARDKEIDSVLTMQADLEAEHQRLTGELARAEAAWITNKTRLETERTLAIDRATAALNTHTAAQAPVLAAKNRERTERIATAKRTQSEAEPAARERQAAWEQSLLKTLGTATAWTPFQPKEVKAGGSVKIETLPDGSHLASGNVGESPEYTLTAPIQVTNLTGIKIEVLPHPRLPAFGPGWKEGNFVLSEVYFDAASKTNDSKFTRTKVVGAVADYTETGFDLSHVFDDRGEQGRKEGWSVGGAPGAPHWLALKLEKPAGYPEGSLVRIQLLHRYQPPYEIGRFRVYFTTAPDPLQEGVPDTLAHALTTPPDSRTPEQRDLIEARFRMHDDTLRKLDQAVALAERPLPEDARLKELERDLARANEPVRTDPALVQLRADAEASTAQLTNRRLTAAQDLAWALINNPAFLFNR